MSALNALHHESDKLDPWGAYERIDSVLDVADFPQLEYSMKAVRRAGNRLAKEVLWLPEDRDEVLDTFQIANNWRDSHVFPMRSMRMSIIQRMRYAEIGGFTAARSKRMSSIRKKLQRLGCELNQINDLAGCRAVLDDIESVNHLIRECKDRVPHNLRQEYDYIGNPKPDGYRSHHMVFLFEGKGDSAVFNGRRIELQIRTRLQHSWATAVEAVGLYRGEDMKGGEGNLDWLRLFQLMSAEFAYAENCMPLEHDLSRHNRVSEIRQLNKKLRAAEILEDLKMATHFFQEYDEFDRPQYFLIQYDHDEKAGNTVSVRPFSNPIEGSKYLGALEERITLEGRNSKVVLVDVDKIDGLAEAYPNYFGDVSLFIRNLKSVCDGRQAIEYSMAPPKLVAPKPYEQPDMSWLRNRHRRWK